MTRDGGFARFVAVPEKNCIVLPKSLDPEIAVLAEPLTVCRQAVDHGGVKPSDRILVMGPGTIGQGIALMARLAGAREIVLCGRNDRPRLKTAKALGIDPAVDLAELGADEYLQDIAGEGFDTVFEATGAGSTIRFGLDHLRPGGTLILCGIHEAPASFDVTRAVRREQTIRGSYRAPLSTWPKVIAALAAAPDMFAPMITLRMRLAEGLEAFAKAHARAKSKILLIPET